MFITVNMVWKDLQKDIAHVEKILSAKEVFLIIQEWIHRNHKFYFDKSPYWDGIKIFRDISIEDYPTEYSMFDENRLSENKWLKGIITADKKKIDSMLMTISMVIEETVVFYPGKTCSRCDNGLGAYMDTISGKPILVCRYFGHEEYLDGEFVKTETRLIPATTELLKNYEFI